MDGTKIPQGTFLKMPIPSPSGLSKKGGWVNSLVDPGGLEVGHLKNGTPSSIEWRDRTNIS